MRAAAIVSKPDTLDQEVRRFKQQPLGQTAFLNSVPKCGTHLLRNILRMFVPVEQHYAREFLQIPNLQQHIGALAKDRPMFSVGHMLWADMSAIALKHARHVILVRDPYDYVLARARFSLSDQFDHPNLRHLKNGAITGDQMINMMIFGVPGASPAVREVFMFHAIAWMNAGGVLVRYEDIVRELGRLESSEAQTFFHHLLELFGIALPDDWRERVRIGSNRRFSATAREHLTGNVSLPASLNPTQMQLVDFAAPGLRELLGYAPRH